jgi:hypothetical protein
MNDHEVKTVPLGARVPRDIATIIKSEATRRDVSISKVIEQALREHARASESTK